MKVDKLHKKKKSLRDFFNRYKNSAGVDALYFLAAKSSVLPVIPVDVVGRQNIFDYLVKNSADVGPQNIFDHLVKNSTVSTPLIEESPIRNEELPIHEVQNGNTSVATHIAVDVQSSVITSNQETPSSDENLDPSRSPSKEEMVEKEMVEEMVEKETVEMKSSPISDRLRRNLRSLNIKD